MKHPLVEHLENEMQKSVERLAVIDQDGHTLSADEAIERTVIVAEIASLERILATARQEFPPLD